MSLGIPGYLGSFGELLTDHLVMALGASLLGLTVALPLGLVCVRWPRLYPPALAVSCRSRRRRSTKGVRSMSSV